MGKIWDWVRGKRRPPGQLRFDRRYNKKAGVNRDAHHITFPRAETVFYDPDVLFKPDRIKDGEERWHAVGLTHDGLLTTVSFTMRGKDDNEKIRIVEARPAKRNIREIYQDKKRG